MRVPTLGCSCIQQILLKLKKGNNFGKKIAGFPPLLVWVPLLMVNNYSEFQVNIFSNKRDIRKCQSFTRRRCRLRQGYVNTSMFSSKTAKLKIIIKYSLLSRALLTVVSLQYYYFDISSKLIGTQNGFKEYNLGFLGTFSGSLVVSSDFSNGA